MRVMLYARASPSPFPTIIVDVVPDGDDDGQVYPTAFSCEQAHIF